MAVCACKQVGRLLMPHLVLLYHAPDPSWVRVGRSAAKQDLQLRQNGPDRSVGGHVG